jgi:hypothetical protein
MTGRNPWAILRVAEDAPYHEIQSAFRRRVKETHPDSGGDAGEFATVVHAFDAVRRAPAAPRCPKAPPPTGRTPYDRWLRPSRPTSSWTDDRAPAPVVSHGPDGVRVTPTTGSAGSDFTTVLRGEMSKARATAGCA